MEDFVAIEPEAINEASRRIIDAMCKNGIRKTDAATIALASIFARTAIDRGFDPFETLKIAMESMSDETFSQTVING